MGQETVIFSSEETADRQRVSSFLRELADKIDSGEVILQQGTDEVSLSIPDQVTLEVKAEEEHDETGEIEEFSLEVEIEWKPGAAVSGVGLG
ncbi:MAG: amphi-Trp domain-containing protein [candidate division WS1 bacterium]|jgi:amphi-Trp domain-containing protein|nr:amphi-Trp domain-containing protein [candidate division WS1 bacterium]